MKFTTRAQAMKQTDLSYIGTINSSAKIIKNKKVSNNYTYIIYLAPYNLSGYNVCLHSTPECRLGCLNTSGRAKIEEYSGFTSIQECRAKKTRLFYEHQEFFMQWVVAEMKSYQAKAKRDGYDFSARLNGTSDINWNNVTLEGKTIFEIFPDVQFYDYTKDYAKAITNEIPNYHLTFSYSGKNEIACMNYLQKGGNVAVVFKKDLPTTWKSFPVINGDITDFRPNDGKGVIVGLKFKTIGNRENNEKIKNSCFVVDYKAECNVLVA